MPIKKKKKTKVKKKVAKKVTKNPKDWQTAYDEFKSRKHKAIFTNSDPELDCTGRWAFCLSL